MISDLLSLADSFDTGMTNFQLDKFVLAEQLTPYRLIRQSVIELKARLENSVSLELDIEELDVKIEQLSVPVDDKFAQRLNIIQRQRHIYEKTRKEAMLKQLARESHTLASTAMEVLGENWKCVDDFKALLIDPKALYKEEQLYWRERFQRGATSDLVNYGTISKGVLEAILLLEPAETIRILKHSVSESVKLSCSISQSKANALASFDR